MDPDIGGNTQPIERCCLDVKTEDIKLGRGGGHTGLLQNEIAWQFAKCMSIGRCHGLSLI